MEGPEGKREGVTPKEAYLKLGVNGLREALSGTLTVQEVVNAPKVRVVFESGNWTVFKRGRRVELTDRVLDPRLRVVFERLERPRFDGVPDGEYDIAYFPSNRPGMVEYDRVPRNRLLVLARAAEADRVVEALGCESLGFTYFGRPNQAQVGALTAALRRSIRGPVSPFEIMEILGTAQAINGAPDAKFGGLVMKFADHTVRVPDPRVEAEVAMALEARESLDIYGIMLADFVEWFERSGNVAEHLSTEGGPAKAFLDTASRLCAAYLRDRRDVVRDIHVSDRGFELDEKLLPEGVDLETENERQVFQMVLNALHRPGKRPTGTLTEGILTAVARISRQIKQQTNGGPASAVPSYEDYLTMKDA